MIRGAEGARCFLGESSARQPRQHTEGFEELISLFYIVDVSQCVFDENYRKIIRNYMEIKVFLRFFDNY